MSPVDLKDYVDVKERIRLFYAAYPDGRLCTGEVRASREPDDVPRVWVQAFAYRSPEDVLPGVGWSWLMLPGATSFTRGSEIENAETSAWGRAIGALGIGIAAGIASADEVRAKSVKADVERGDDGSLIGTAEVGDRSTSDYSLRNTPDGPVLGFRLRGDKGGILVRTRGQLARDLDTLRTEVIGHRVTCWGRITTETFTPAKKGAREVSYQVLDADRVSIPGLPPLPTALTEAPHDKPLLADAESEAMFDEVERLGA